MLYWIFHLYWIFRRFNTLYNLLYSTNTDQAPSGWHYSPSQAGIQVTDSDLYFWSESVPGLQRRGLGHAPGNLHPAAWARIGAAWAGNPRDGFKIFEESIKIDLKYLRQGFAQKNPFMRSGKEPQLPVLLLCCWLDSSFLVALALFNLKMANTSLYQTLFLSSSSFDLQEPMTCYVGSTI